MKIRVLAVSIAACVATAAFAQTDTGSHNPAIKSSAPHMTKTAASGRNSFTESQAQDRIAKAGYADVSRLLKNDSGVWQGTALKDGAKVNVGLDYKGNVTVR